MVAACSFATFASIPSNFYNIRDGGNPQRVVVGALCRFCAEEKMNAVYNARPSPRGEKYCHVSEERTWTTDRHLRYVPYELVLLAMQI